MGTKKEKGLNYYKNNAKEDYITTPISVLRYITELEERGKELERSLDASTSSLKRKTPFNAATQRIVDWGEELLNNK